PLTSPAPARSPFSPLGALPICALAAALELGHRHLAADLERGEALGDPAAAGRYFAQRLRGLGHEVFAALYLDTRHRALGFEELLDRKSTRLNSSHVKISYAVFC